MEAITIQPYRVSTITAIGQVLHDCQVNLEELYDSFTIVEGVEGFTYAEQNMVGANKSKGFHRKKNIIRRKKAPKKKFEGYTSCLLCFMSSTKKLQSVNIKTFKNGVVHITGLKTEEDGEIVMEKLAQHIKHNLVDYHIVPSDDHIRPGGLRICLINSDFTINVDGKRATIIREKLYHILQNNYSTFCQFDAVVHPSVRANFCYNDAYENPNGICKCTGKCDGKGSGHGEGKCKKVTIAVFGSGCVIITGAQTFTQLNAAYTFISNIIKNHYTDFIEQFAASPVVAPIEMSAAAVAMLMNRGNW